MLWGKAHGSSRLLVGSIRRHWRQFAALATVCVLAGCGSSEELGTVGYVEGFLGGVAADEPQAVQIGRDVLSAGGSAADAVVAMYFASAVTLPSAASLGGGGVCLGFDSDTGEVRALDFLARRPTRGDVRAERPTAVPGNVRGFYAFHARYGRLRWSQLISPAESLARFGFRVSRSLAADIKQVGGALSAQSGTLRAFSTQDGARLVGEGDFLTQVELASVLARIRAEGAGPFYTGPLARQIVDGAKRAGSDLDINDLRDYAPLWREPVRVPMGNRSAYFTPAPTVGGVIEALMWESLLAGSRFGSASALQRLRIIADLGTDTAAERRRLMRSAGGGSDEAHLENPSAATFVAADRNGAAAACAVTLNSLFGTGRIAEGTGIVLAAAPGPGGRGATALGPMLIVNQNVNEFFFGGAASGGVAAPSALVGVAARAVLGGESLSEAISAKRAVGGAAPGVVYYEGGAGSEAEAALAGLGTRRVATTALGRVNAVYCPDGIPPNPETCVARSDPRGFGLTAMADPGS